MSARKSLALSIILLFVLPLASSLLIILSSIQPAQAATPAPPQVLQTLDYNFRITPHEVTTATSYVYTTPAGNYSFSKALPWLLKYVSLQGTTVVTLSAFGVQYASLLLPLTLAVVVQPPSTP